MCKNKRTKSRLRGQISIFLCLYKGNCKFVLSASTLLFCVCKIRNYSCISNMFSEIGNWLLQWGHQDLQGVLLQGIDHRIRQVTYKFVPNNIPTFWLLALNGFNSIFLLPIYRSCIETISCIKQCNNLGLSLHFKSSLQSTGYILFLVFILNLIWSLHFILTENNKV